MHPNAKVAEPSAALQRQIRHDPWVYFDTICARQDLHVTLSAGSDYSWSCDLTIVDSQPSGTPDHGYTIHAIGGLRGVDALAEALIELVRWRGVSS